LDLLESFTPLPSIGSGIFIFGNVIINVSAGVVYMLLVGSMTPFTSVVVTVTLHTVYATSTDIVMPGMDHSINMSHKMMMRVSTGCTTVAAMNMMTHIVMKVMVMVGSVTMSVTMTVTMSVTMSVTMTVSVSVTMSMPCP